MGYVPKSLAAKMVSAFFGQEIVYVSSFRKLKTYIQKVFHDSLQKINQKSERSKTICKWKWKTTIQVLLNRTRITRRALLRTSRANQNQNQNKNQDQSTITSTKMSQVRKLYFCWLILNEKRKSLIIKLWQNVLIALPLSLFRARNRSKTVCQYSSLTSIYCSMILPFSNF